MQTPDANGTGPKSVERQDGVRSLETGLRILSVLAKPRPPLSLTAIAEAATLPPSTVHRYLASLARLGFVAREPGSGAYRLGSATLDLGLAALSQVNVIQLGSPAIVALRDEVSETVGLVVWGSAGPTFVRLEEASRNITVNVRAGSVVPVLSSASGQVFAAYLPEPLWMPFALQEIDLDIKFGKSAVPLTIETARQCALQVRETGLSSVSSTVQIGIDALSAPVFDSSDHIAAALSILGSTGSFDNSACGPVATRLRAAARRLSHELGWRRTS